MKTKCFVVAIVTVASGFTGQGADFTGKITKTGSGQGLADAIVYVVSGPQPTTARPQRPMPTIVVKDGRVDPLLTIVQTNQSLTVTNADNGAYNVQLRFGENCPRNHALLPSQSLKIEAAKPELFARVSDDLLRLNGRICVVEHPSYAATDVDGAFKLPDLPPGTYVIEAAHPREGRLRREITIDRADSSSDFALPGR
jgi:hypothetical protein